MESADQKLTGGRVNYYLAHVAFPQREEQAPYTAECEDLIHVLRLTPDEANIFKEIWRGANARKDNGKPGHTPLYGAQKIVHYAGRILRSVQIAMGTYQRPSLPAAEPVKEYPWLGNSTGKCPAGYEDMRVEIGTRDGQTMRDIAFRFRWDIRGRDTDILKWRPL